MPTYAETKATTKADKDKIKNVEKAIKTKKSLTGGYRAIVDYNSTNDKVTQRLDGPHQNINKIPHDVLIAYADVVSQVDAWVAGDLADFPVL